MAEFKTVRGMRDFLPAEAKLLRNVESKARSVAKLYGYKEIVTPIVESYDLLSAKAGEEVKSRMFLFKDLGGRDVALRPEFTASVARLVATTLRNEPRPFRLFSVGTIYRYDEPQRGRYREIWQTNYELMGSSRPEADAEILLLTNSFMQAVGLKKFAFKVGHIGVLKGVFAQEQLVENVQSAVMQLMDKKQYEDAFKLLESAGVSEKCMSTLRELVKLKGSDVKGIIDRIADLVKDYEKSVESAKNLSEILNLVVKSKCNIDLTVDAGFARGLEYYTGAIIEVYVPDLDVALAGGGRYDRLIELFGGDPTPAMGIAHGVDRIMLALQEQKRAQNLPQGLNEEKKVLVIPINQDLSGEALHISQMLVNAGVPTELEIMGRKMTKALEDANRRNMSYAVIIGERELKDGNVIVRDLVQRVQTKVKVEDVAEAVRN